MKIIDNIPVFGPPQENAVEQMKNCLKTAVGIGPDWEDAFEGMDGCCYTQPIMRTLETYTLQEREIKIYGVKKFV